MKKYASYLVIVISSIFLLTGSVSAHVIVVPSEVKTAARQTFTISVPNEKEAPLVTTSLRLAVPAEVEEISPTVTAGWIITTKKDDKGKITEVTWSGGTIPADQRMEFSFRTQAPAKEGTLVWKAYQTYSDGTVVAWDQAPAEHDHDEDVNPYSSTKVVNDLTTSTTEDRTTRTFALVALVLAILALVGTMRRR